MHHWTSEEKLLARKLKMFQLTSEALFGTGHSPSVRNENSLSTTSSLESLASFTASCNRTYTMIMCTISHILPPHRFISDTAPRFIDRERFRNIFDLLKERDVHLRRNGVQPCNISLHLPRIVPTTHVAGGLMTVLSPSANGGSEGTVDANLYQIVDGCLDPCPTQRHGNRRRYTDAAALGVQELSGSRLHVHAPVSSSRERGIL